MGLAGHVPGAEAEGARFEGEGFIYEGRGGVRVGSGGGPRAGALARARGPGRGLGRGAWAGGKQGGLPNAGTEGSAWQGSSPRCGEPSGDTGASRGTRVPRSSACGWGARHTGRCCAEGDFAGVAADSTSSPYTYWGGTRCPSRCRRRSPYYYRAYQQPVRDVSS
jgi:hypothetical protein